VGKAFYLGCEDAEATHRFIVYPGKERFPVSKVVSAIPFSEMMQLFKDVK